MKSGQKHSALVDFCASVNLSLVITKPTRITDCTTSLIDVILVSDENLVTGVADIGISEHSLVHCTLNMKIPKVAPSFVSTRSYKNYDPQSFCAAVSQASFDEVYHASDVNIKLSIFNQLFLYVLDCHAPVKTVKIRNCATPFVTDEIKETMKERDALKKHFRHTLDSAVWSQYIAARNNVKGMLRRAESSHIQEKIYRHKGNTGSMWKTIRKCLPARLATTPSYNKDIDLVATEFNEFFTSVGQKAAEAASKLLGNIDSDSFASAFSSAPYTASQPFNFRSVLSCEIQKFISTMPLNKAPRLYKMSMRVIKECLAHILRVLTDIITAH